MVAHGVSMVAMKRQPSKQHSLAQEAALPRFDATFQSPPLSVDKHVSQAASLHLHGAHAGPSTDVDVATVQCVPCPACPASSPHQGSLEGKGSTQPRRRWDRAGHSAQSVTLMPLFRRWRLQGTKEGRQGEGFLTEAKLT